MTIDSYARVSVQDPVEELDSRQLARRRLLHYTTYTYNAYLVDSGQITIAKYLQQILTGKIKRLMIFAPPQHGKLIAHSVPVLTTKGWVTHGELKIGDYVFNKDGFPTEVLAISEDGEANQEIEFTNGETITCHARHEWPVFDRTKNSNHRNCMFKYETKQMRDQGVWYGEHGKRGGRAKFQVDVNVPVQMPEINLSIHPYILGFWLGDGSTGKNCITYHPDDMDVVEKFEDLGIKETTLVKHSKTGIFTSYFRSLYSLLKNNPVWNNKHIPDVYFTASIEQRLELLAGLIDSDGYVYRKNGRTVFSNTNERLVQDVVRLIATLGWRTTVSKTAPKLSSFGIQGKKDVYQVTFNPDLPLPVVLKRKRNGKLNPRRRRRGIKDIRSCIPVPGRCIQVEGGIYLVGDTLIPTHNSELVSIRFPAFWFAKRPDDPIILCSYGEGHAYDKVSSTRQVIQSLQSQKLFPDLAISPLTRGGTNWRIKNHRGRMVSAGVGGPITGYGAMLGIIDDPLKNWQEAESQNIRDRTWEWYRTTFRTRIWENGAIILVMTRWHESDLAGRLLKDQSEKWTIVRLPAVAETQAEWDENARYLNLTSMIGKKDLAGRKPGEALCPSRFSKEALLDIKSDIGSMAWAGQYMGVPRLPEGNIIKRDWFKIVEPHELPIKESVFVRYWDKAATEGGGARTAGVLLCRSKVGHYYVVDVIKGQWATTKRNNIIAETAKRDREIFGKVTIYLEQEGGSGGIDSYKETARVLAGYTIRKDSPSGAKLSRLGPFEGQSGAGNVSIVRGPWNWDWMDELTAVPNSAYWDQADATSGAFNKIAKTGWSKGMSN